MFLALARFDVDCQYYLGDCLRLLFVLVPAFLLGTRDVCGICRLLLCVQCVNSIL
jgi:hypothetical protein